jgi:hypothetical protein
MAWLRVILVWVAFLGLIVWAALLLAGRLPAVLWVSWFCVLVGFWLYSGQRMRALEEKADGGA